jgi:hypothetical protein
MPTKAEEAGWLSSAMLKRASSETAWEGALDEVAGEPPLGVPMGVWAVARKLVSGENDEGEREQQQPQGATDDPDRHVIARHLRLTCIPVTRVEYSFDGREFDFTAVGPSGSERFWAESFPARWTRVGRFFRAVMRDLNGERGEGGDGRQLPGGAPRPLDEYRVARHVRILPDLPDTEDGRDASASPVDQPPHANDDTVEG